MIQNSSRDDFRKEFVDAFNNYNRSVDSIVRRASELDKNNFKIYDFISREIPHFREVSNFARPISAIEYNRLLDCMEYIYTVVKGVL